MTDFRDAFKQGLEAHLNAERTTLEIVSVFRNLGREVAEATDGKITVQRAKNLRDLSRTLFDSLTGAMPALEPYNCLEAVLKGKPTEKIELCSYTLDPGGYPVSISYEGHIEDGFDKASLESVLGNLLRHPAIGRRFQTLLDKWQPESKQEITAGSSPSSTDPAPEE